MNNNGDEQPHSGHHFLSVKGSMAAVADSPIIYEQFLDAEGNPADPAVASMRVTVTEMDAASAAEVDRERR